jgi:hypothetical protein
MEGTTIDLAFKHDSCQPDTTLYEPDLFAARYCEDVQPERLLMAKKYLTIARPDDRDRDR